MPSTLKKRSLQPAIKAKTVRSGSPIWIIPATRNAGTEAFGAPFHLIPRDALALLSVGCHDWLPYTLVAFVSVANDVCVAIEGPPGICASVLVRIWTRESEAPMCREAIFHTHGDYATATASMGAWNGRPVAGIALLPIAQPGEEQ